MTSKRSPSRRARPAVIVRRLSALLGFIAAIWIAHGVDRALGGALTRTFGLLPRRLEGLDGVVAMPFLHVDWSHLAANTVPLLALGGLILISAPRNFGRATVISVLLSGVLIWLFARSAVHIGASGLVFAWFGFLTARAVVDRRWRAIAGAVAALGLYGATMLFGLSPFNADVSWEGHLAGLVAGIVAARVLRDR